LIRRPAMKPVDPSHTVSTATHIALQALDQSVQDMPDDISLRLRQQRLRALALRQEQPQPRRKGLWPIPAPLATTLASAVLIALVFWLNAPAPETAPSVAQNPMPNQILANDLNTEEWTELTQLSNEDWDMLQDLEFAIWLSEQPDESLQSDRAG
jgi:hypothetical protein